MKKFIYLFCFLPLIVKAQSPDIVSVTRFFPKNDKIAEFEKSLKNHANKFHTGNFKWRVYTIESGPDAGGYQAVEMANTWEQIDKRGDLGAEHQADLYKNVMPLVEKVTSMYITYREDLSSIPLNDFSDKIAVTHVFPKPGKALKVEESIAPLKKTWDDAKQSIVVYEASSSGPVQYSVVTRYKDGLKERSRGFRKPIKERFDGLNGAGTYEKWLDSVAENVESQWGELLFYNAELSSK